jgi:hypothetical protein
MRPSRPLRRTCKARVVEPELEQRKNTTQHANANVAGVVETLHALPGLDKGAGVP